MVIMVASAAFRISQHDLNYYQSGISLVSTVAYRYKLFRGSLWFLYAMILIPPTAFPTHSLPVKSGMFTLCSMHGQVLELAPSSVCCPLMRDLATLVIFAQVQIV